MILTAYLPLTLEAQKEKPSFRSIDSLTYALYSQQQWNEMIESGNLALAHNIDYFYLRMRMGIAWYSKENYHQSIPHFEAALKFNAADQTALEYLYFCYLMSGRQADVRRTKPKLSKTALEKIGVKRTGILEEIYVEGGPGIASNEKVTDKLKQPAPEYNIYNETYFYDNYAYFHGGAKFYISPAISTYQSYGLVNAPFTQRVRYQNQPLEDFTFTTHQNEYYGNLVIGLANGIQITPAWHFIWFEMQNRQFRYDTITFRLVSDTVVEGIHDFVFSFSVKKDFPVFSLGLDGTFGIFDNVNQGQLGISAWVYPFGNLNFYAQTSLINSWQPEEYNLIFYQMLGGRLVKDLWLEGSFAIGNLTNFAENNAFIIYNAPEKINYKFETVLIYSLNKHLEFSARYRLMQRENEYLYYYTFDDFNVTTTEYFFHSVIGSVKWRL